MLRYLLAHPEFSFSAPETADLCAAFDMAVAILQERDNAANWAADSVQAALAAEIVHARLRGEKDPKRLSERAARAAETASG